MCKINHMFAVVFFICLVVQSVRAGDFSPEPDPPDDTSPGSGFSQVHPFSDTVNDILPVFKPNEAVSIRVFPDSTSFFNGIYKIDDQGFITLPIMGKLLVKNMSESRLIDTIKDRCIDYLPFPNIKVSFMIRLTVLGGFYKPGLYWIDSRSSIWDAIQLAGGLQREDGLKLLRWERDGKIISNNLIADFQSGKSLGSMGFRSGDQLCLTSQSKTRFSFRDHFVPFFTLFLTTLSTGLTIYTITKRE